VLRFAAGELARERARVRLLLVLSDGKPYDEDEYASEYGVADVRRAVAEAELLDVHPFCVTVDREGPSYLGRLFGAGRFTLLCNVAQLPERLPELYRRLTAGA
jgi:nitric oxide reductase NorD protein